MEPTNKPTFAPSSQKMFDEVQVVIFDRSCQLNLIRQLKLTTNNAHITHTCHPCTYYYQKNLDKDNWLDVQYGTTPPSIILTPSIIRTPKNTEEHRTLNTIIILSQLTHSQHITHPSRHDGDLFVTDIHELYVCCGCESMNVNSSMCVWMSHLLTRA